MHPRHSAHCTQAISLVPTTLLISLQNILHCKNFSPDCFVCIPAHVPSCTLIPSTEAWQGYVNCINSIMDIKRSNCIGSKASTVLVRSRASSGSRAACKLHYSKLLNCPSGTGQAAAGSAAGGGVPGGCHFNASSTPHFEGNPACKLQSPPSFPAPPPFPPHPPSHHTPTYLPLYWHKGSLGQHKHL